MDALAKFDEVVKVGLVVEVVPRTTYDRWVWIMGERFDAEDLYETMHAVSEDASGTHITDSRIVRAMTEIGIISGTSGSWGTTVKSEARLNQFLGMLEKALLASKSEIV